MSEETEKRKLLFDFWKFAIAIFGALVAFVVGLWQFSINARNDFVKPVMQKQLELCVETSHAAATLAQDPQQNLGPSNKIAMDYLSLYYGRLGVVEDRCLYRTMIHFKSIVFDKQELFDSKGEKVSPNRAALRIAFACRRLLSKNWGKGLLGLYDPQHLVESFTDLPDYRDSMKEVPDCDN